METRHGAGHLAVLYGDVRFIYGGNDGQRGPGGLGLSLPDALGNVYAIRERTTLLAEDGKVASRLLSLLADLKCHGKQVHDANVVATMLVHGVRAVVTINLEDFARFEGHVSVIQL